MYEVGIVKEFENGSVNFLEGTESIDRFAWKDHPKFNGVSLKAIITGNDTNSQISCHLVRIQPGCEIGNHIHEGRMELHEVIAGDGVCIMKEKEIPYNPGIIAVIPPDITHRVTAGTNGVFILAKFLPALE